MGPHIHSHLDSHMDPHMGFHKGKMIPIPFGQGKFEIPMPNLVTVAHATFMLKGPAPNSRIEIISNQFVSVRIQYFLDQFWMNMKSHGNPYGEPYGKFDSHSYPIPMGIGIPIPTATLHIIEQSVNRLRILLATNRLSCRLTSILQIIFKIQRKQL